MKQIILEMLVLLTAGCVTFGHNLEEPVDPQVRAFLESRVTQGENAIDEQNYGLAIELFTKFEKDYPNSMFLYRSKIGHGRALAGENKFTEALQFYREVSDAALGRKPEFVALSSYYSSYCYEALGDDNKTFASLQDAKNMSDKLPPEVAQAELPARLAAYYNRVGDVESARKFYHQAEQGIAIVFHDESAKSKKSKARTFYLMGQLLTDQVSVENLQATMDSLAMMQIFLLHSIESKDSQWSPAALKNLQGNYKDLWNAILLIPKNKALDVFAAEQEQKEAQAKALGQLLDLIQKLKVYEAPLPTVETGVENQFSKDLFSFLGQLEDHAQQMLSTSGTLPLTPEAQKRQSLHREGTVREHPTEIKESKVQKILEDPNLQGN